MKKCGRLGAALLCLSFLRPAPAAAADLSGVEEFPGDLARGFREEARAEGLLTLTAAGMLAAVARYPRPPAMDDYRIAGTLQRHKPLGKRVTDFGAVIGYPVYLMAGMGATYFGGWAAHCDPAQEFGLLGFEALSLAGIQALILKYSVSRVRPDLSDRYAFPSGHTAGSFALATAAAATWGWQAGVPAYMLAGFVGYTRMEGQNHYLSDVLFGAGLGIASGRAAYKARRKTHPAAYAFAPFVFPGGGGVTVLF